jgi:hypothetical protein
VTDPTDITPTPLARDADILRAGATPGAVLQYAIEHVRTFAHVPLPDAFGHWLAGTLLPLVWDEHPYHVMVIVPRDLQNGPFQLADARTSDGVTAIELGDALRALGLGHLLLPDPDTPATDPEPGVQSGALDLATALFVSGVHARVQVVGQGSTCVLHLSDAQAGQVGALIMAGHPQEDDPAPQAGQ